MTLVCPVYSTHKQIFVSFILTMIKWVSIHIGTFTKIKALKMFTTNKRGENISAYEEGGKSVWVGEKCRMTLKGHSDAY